jgi:hypothetical protein
MGPFLAPLNIAFYYIFADVLIVFSIIFGGKLKRSGS